jgi:Bacterial Ig-like domain (group 2)
MSLRCNEAGLAWRLTPFAMALMMLAGCGDPPKPTAPSPSATVTALAIATPPASMKAGETFQLAAIATLSNGLPATTGFTVQWTASDTSVVIVSATGLITAQADGNATISASANSITASVPIKVRSGGRIVTGVVTESAPTQDTGIPGALVAVADGLYAGETTTADARGAFTLRNVNGIVNLRISAQHFEDTSLTADTDSPAAVAVRLLPTDRTVNDTAQWEPPPPNTERVWQGQLSFALHRAGRVDVVTSANLSDFESAPNCSELRDDINRTIVWSTSAPWQGDAQKTFSLGVGKYTLKVSGCRDLGRPVVSSYRLGATHPY